MKASLRSPKNKYQGVIDFDEPIEGIGNFVRFTANDIAQLKAICEGQAQDHQCTISILENKAEYPSFDWQQVEKYN